MLATASSRKSESKVAAPSPAQSGASIWERVLFAALFALFVFGVTFVLDWVLVREGDRGLKMAAVSDALSAAVISVLVWRLVEMVEARRARMQHRIEQIEQTNHHIRNALQAITLTAQRYDDETVRVINGAIDRIDWVLREVLPAEPAARKPPAGESTHPHR